MVRDMVSEIKIFHRFRRVAESAESTSPPSPHSPNSQKSQIRILNYLLGQLQKSTMGFIPAHFWTANSRVHADRSIQVLIHS